MYQQRVKATSYLAKVTVDLEEIAAGHKAVILPRGAEVISVSVEASKGAAGSISVGLNEKQDFFVDNVDLATDAYIASAVTTATKDLATVTISPAQAIGTITLRVVYFAPGEIVTEF